MAHGEKNKKRSSGGKPDKCNNFSASAPPAEEEYRVGPGRPPKEHQWKPGQSGNRRQAKKAIAYPRAERAVRACFSQKLKVLQGDRQRFITRWVAGLEQLSIQFAKGDRHAHRDVLYFAEKLGVDLLNSAKAPYATLPADHQAILDAYVERRTQEKDLRASSPVLAPPELLDDAPDAGDEK